MTPASWAAVAQPPDRLRLLLKATPGGGVEPLGGVQAFAGVPPAGGEVRDLVDHAEGAGAQLTADLESCLRGRFYRAHEPPTIVVTAGAA